MSSKYGRFGVPGGKDREEKYSAHIKQHRMSMAEAEFCISSVELALLKIISNEAPEEEQQDIYAQTINSISS